jgi:hypothetical protein
MAKQRHKDKAFELARDGKTDKARKDLERLALIRKQRDDAAKRRDAEKAGSSQN